ncbi:MAG TPA: Ig-like domain-containing protein [Myxococcales bacterium]|nr:Ig-like domain-containing protein [Myxococcales bacterium]
MGGSVLLDGTASTDPQGRALLYDWSFANRPPASRASFNDAHIAKPSFVPDLDGQYVVALVVSNGVLSSPPSNVTVTVRKCGEAAPVVTAVTATPANPNAGTQVQLDAAVTDADNSTACGLNQTFTLLWTTVSRPGTSSTALSDPTAKNPTITPDVVGAYQFSVVATDSTGLQSAPKFVTFKVAACGAAAVTFDGPPITAVFAETRPNVGAAVMLTAHPIDPGVACGVPAGTVQYRWTLAGPSGSTAVSFATQAGTQFSFTPDVVGTYDVTVRAVDAQGHSSDASTSISTTTCGVAPIAVQVNPASSTVNSFDSLPLTATPAATTCPARFAPTIAWAVSGVGAPAQLSSSSGTAVSFRASGPGDYVVSAVAINTSGQEGPVGTASVHVDACGSHPPVVVTTNNSPTFPARLQTVALSATAVDPDTACGAGRPSSIAFELVSIPQGSALTFPAGATTFQGDVEGTYSFRVVATESGTGLRSDAAILNVTVLDPDPTASTLTAVATSGAAFVVADNVDSATVRVTLHNRLGQPVAALPVSIAANGTGNAFSPASIGSSDTNGVLTVTMTSTKAETKTFTAIANQVLAPVTLSSHPSVDFVAGPTASIKLTGLPANVTAGDFSTVTVTAFDKFANVAKGPNAYAGTVQFSSTDSGATLPANFPFVAGDDGTHTFTNGVRLITAGSRTVTVTDTVKLALTDTQTAVVSPAAPATVAFTVQPSTATAGISISPAVETTVKDTFANLVPNASVTVSIGSGPVATLFGTKTESTGTNGVAGFANLSIQKAGTGYKLHAAVTGTPGDDSTAFDIRAAAPATAAFTVQPTTTTTGQHITPAVDVTVKDQFLNLVPGASAAMAIGTNPAGGILSGTLLQTTNLSGVASFANLSIDKAGTGYTLQTTVTSTPANVVQDSASFNVVVPPSITSFLAAPANIFSGGATQLSFVFSGGTGSINPGAHSVSASGTLVVANITTTTTFTLTVTNAAGTTTSATATATLTTPTGWLDLNNPSINPLDTRAAQPFSLTFDPANSSIIYAATLSKGVLTTSTGGPPWASTNFPAGDQALGVSVGHPITGLSIWVSVNCAGKLQHSTNGTTWTEVDGTANGLPAKACPIPRSAIVLDPSDSTHKTLYVGFSQGGLFRSIDDGTTWSNIPLILANSTPDNQPTALAIASNGTLFVGTNGGNLFRVSGISMTPLTTADPAPATQVNAIAVDPEGNIVVAGHTDGVLESATGPSFTFSIIDAFASGTSVGGVAFAVDGASSAGVVTGSIYAVTAGATADGKRVFRSSNLGASFLNVTTATPAIDTSDYFFVTPHPTDGTTLYVLGQSSGFFKRTFGAP